MVLVKIKRRVRKLP